MLLLTKTEYDMSGHMSQGSFADEGKKVLNTSWNLSLFVYFLLSWVYKKLFHYIFISNSSKIQEFIKTYILISSKIKDFEKPKSQCQARSKNDNNNNKKLSCQ